MRTIENLAPMVATGRTEQARERRVERNCVRRGSVLRARKRSSETHKALRAFLQPRERNLVCSCAQHCCQLLFGSPTSGPLRTEQQHPPAHRRDGPRTLSPEHRVQDQAHQAQLHYASYRSDEELARDAEAEGGRDGQVEEDQGEGDEDVLPRYWGLVRHCVRLQQVHLRSTRPEQSGRKKNGRPEGLVLDLVWPLRLVHLARLDSSLPAFLLNRSHRRRQPASKRWKPSPSWPSPDRKSVV